ncbi:MAG: leucine-rich repeat protein [Turicibacter sp.]|nr:leucine-rich repeat protein [Turicibacter sp.]
MFKKMLKRMTATLLAFALVATSLPVVAAVDDGNFSVEVVGGVSTIMGLRTTPPAPTTHNIVIPPNSTEITPSTLTHINSGAFDGAGLTGSVTFPPGSGITHINNNAFRGNIGVTAVIFNAGSAIRVIGTDAFLNNNINTLTIQNANQLTDIETEAFANNDIASLTLPNNLQNIGNAAFRNNPRITSLNLSNLVNLQTIGDNAFADNNISTLTLPTLTGGATYTIGQNAFANNDLTSITIPASVRQIYTGAFSGNSDLVRIHLNHTNGNDINLLANAFSGVSADLVISHPPNATNFDTAAFSGLRLVPAAAGDPVDPDWLISQTGTGANAGIIIRGIHASSALNSATDIEIPDEIAGLPVRLIDTDAFLNLTALVDVTIPASITNIAPNAFRGNTALRSATFLHTNGANVQGVTGSFTNAHNTFTIQFPFGAEGFTTPTWRGYPAVPDGDLTSIWSFSTFAGEVLIDGYTGSAAIVEIPSTINNMPVRQVLNGTFANNNVITEIIIPSSVTSIGALAVNNLPNLRIARVRHTNADTLDLSGMAFANVHADFTILFPADSTGFTTPTWVGFAAAPDLIAAHWEFTTTGGNVTITAYNGDEVIVEVPEQINGNPVRTIATGAFRNNDTIERVIIPQNVNAVQANAFNNNRNLYAAELLHTAASQIPNLATDSFVGVAPHFRIVLQQGATGFSTPTWRGYFVETAIDGMTNVQDNFEYLIRRDAATGNQPSRDVVVITRYLGTTAEVELPNVLGNFPVVGIGDFAFMQNQNLRRVTIPAGIVEIGHSAFMGASNLQYAVFLHSSTAGLTLRNTTFANVASDFTILYPATATGFSTPTWQGFPARVNDGADTGVDPTTPPIDEIPPAPGGGGGVLPEGGGITPPVGEVRNPLIFTHATLNANASHTTRDGQFVQPPIFRLEPFAPNPAFSTSYVMPRVIGDILGLDISFNDATRTATFSGFDAQNNFVVLEMTIDSTTMRVNGAPREVRASAGIVPVIVRADRMLIPVAVFQEVFGVEIQWNGATQSVTVNP